MDAKTAMIERLEAYDNEDIMLWNLTGMLQRLRKQTPEELQTSVDDGEPLGYYEVTVNYVMLYTPEKGWWAEEEGAWKRRKAAANQDAYVCGILASLDALDSRAWSAKRCELAKTAIMCMDPAAVKQRVDEGRSLHLWYFRGRDWNLFYSPESGWDVGKDHES